MIPSLQVGDLEGFRDKDEKVFRNLTETIYTDVPGRKPVWEVIVRLPEVCESRESISMAKGSIAFPGSPPLMITIHISSTGISKGKRIQSNSWENTRSSELSLSPLSSLQPCVEPLGHSESCSNELMIFPRLLKTLSMNIGLFRV